MKHVICPVCGKICFKYGKTKAGSQRWYCSQCKIAFSPTIDNLSKQLKIFLQWLFGKKTQKNMLGEGRTFRRKTAQFWKIWPLPPVIATKEEVLFVDGIYPGRKACILICCNKDHKRGAKRSELFRYGAMRLYGASCIAHQNTRCIGIENQHVLSYNPHHK